MVQFLANRCRHPVTTGNPIGLLTGGPVKQAYDWPVAIGIEIKYSFYWDNPSFIVNIIQDEAAKNYAPQTEVVIVYGSAQPSPINSLKASWGTLCDKSTARSTW